jgi:hypothetical protein
MRSRPQGKDLLFDYEEANQHTGHDEYYRDENRLLSKPEVRIPCRAFLDKRA